MKKLYFGDCLDVLKKLHQEYPKGFIDLIFIDPPFNSKRGYNILFESLDMKDAKAQREAFADTWSNVSYKDTIDDIQHLDVNLWKLLDVLDTTNVSKSAMAYLSTMAIRIYYMHKVLKDTGSFYLHCDPTMSHYLKIICDFIFGEKNFNNQIVWKRTSSHSNAKGYGSSYDLELFYNKSSAFTWNPQYEPYDEDYINTYYRYKDENGRRFLSDNLVGHKGVNKEYEWKGIIRPWRYPKDRLDELEAQGKIFWTKNNFPRFKRYLDEMPGLQPQNIWTDIKSIGSWSKEGLGYPTQKPEALLERIIKASTNEGDLVADFFCGCGTTIAAAEKLGRNWIGADISHLAIKLIVDRLSDPYKDDNSEKYAKIRASIDIDGFPKDVGSAHMLAEGTDKHRALFQDWIIEVMLSGIANKKKSGDGGYDGYIPFNRSVDGKGKGVALVEVKSGGNLLTALGYFISTVEKMNAVMGVFVCFKDKVTKGMLDRAKSVGKIKDADNIFQYPVDKIQIVTVEDLLEGKGPKYPLLASSSAFKRATQKNYDNDSNQMNIGEVKEDYL